MPALGVVGVIMTHVLVAQAGAVILSRGVEVYFHT